MSRKAPGDGLGVRRKSFKFCQDARRLAHRGISLCSEVSKTGSFQEIVDSCAGEGMGKATRGQYRVCSHAIVAGAERGIGTKQYLACIPQPGQEREGFTHLD